MPFPLLLFLKIALAAVVALAIFFGTSFSSEKAPRRVWIEKGKKGYRLMVMGRPFLIKGVVYQPTPAGGNWETDYYGRMEQFMERDARLLKELGVNTLRFYTADGDLAKTAQAIRMLHEKYGFYVIMGHWLGFWEDPNYADPVFRETVKQNVLQVVEALKDEEGILMWVLGNENNFSFGPENINPWATPELLKIRDPMARKKAMAGIYYEFVNELAKEIKKIDGTRPVALGNGGLRGLEVASDKIPDVDLIGITMFTGKSFGHVFRDMQKYFDKKPFFIMEFGADSYNALNKQEDQDIQAAYIKCLWAEIERNLYGEGGYGNILGGVVFEWSDEWWKSNPFDQESWAVQDSTATWSCGGYYHDIAADRNMNMNEEWWGIVSLSDELDENGLNKVVPKKAYYSLKEIWNNTDNRK